MRNRIFGDQPSRANSESNCFAPDPLGGLPAFPAFAQVGATDRAGNSWAGLFQNGCLGAVNKWYRDCTIP